MNILPPRSTSRRFIRGLLPACLAGAALTALVAGEPAPTPGVTVTQLTTGPSNHFFGYIGQARTIPWNANGRYLLALETKFQDRLPGKGDAANVCLIDTQDNYRIRVVDRSQGWNPQQGTMFYWNPEHPETQFFFNDRDPKTGKVFTVLFDLTKGPNGGRIREYRFEDTPVGNGGVAQNGGYFTAINYARMARLRAVTGYKDAWDWTKGVAAPENDGIFRVDIETGEKKLIVSFAQLKEKLRGVDPRIETRHMFINHTLNNRNNDRIYFYCRADFAEPDGQRLNVPFTVRPDGSELTRHEIFIGGHPEWEWGSRIIGSANDQQVVYDTASRRIAEVLGGADVFPKPGGDISLSPDGTWFVNGYKGDDEFIRYVFLNRRTGRILHSPKTRLGEWRSGDLRLDPAPCWNRTGDAIVVPGLAEDGSRQMFLIDISQAIRR